MNIIPFFTTSEMADAQFDRTTVKISISNTE